MRGLIKMASGRKRWFAPSLRMVIGIPSGSTEVEIRAVRDSAEHAGGREVYMVFEPMPCRVSRYGCACSGRKHDCRHRVAVRPRSGDFVGGDRFQQVYQDGGRRLDERYCGIYAPPA